MTKVYVICERPHLPRRRPKPQLMWLAAYPTEEAARKWVEEFTGLGGLGYSIVALTLYPENGNLEGNL